jgi:hypothetical protein
MSSCRHELCRIPGIGEKLVQLLRELGYQRIAELDGADPQRMYQRLITLRGAPVDRCVLYAFRGAVYFASNPVHDPQKLKWWYWKDKS